MQSRITIDVDYSNQPVIKIEYKESTDVRDKLVKRFLEQFEHTSQWANIVWRPLNGDNNNAYIKPIPGKHLKDHAELIKTWIDYYEEKSLK